MWDFKTRTEKYRCTQHKQRVQALGFSADGKYLASLGGEDDGTVVVWDMASGRAMCGSATSNSRGGVADTVCFATGSNTTFVTAGNNNIRIWEINRQTNKAIPRDAVTRGMKRHVKCLAVDASDEYIYCGTTTGDILQISLQSGNLKSVGPEKTKFVGGVESVQCLPNGNLVVGSGDGTVAIVKVSTWKAISAKKVEGSVSSVALRGEGHEFYVGTASSFVYRFGLVDLTMEQRLTSHSSAVNDVCFPRDSSELFGTCSYGEIRVWHTPANREVLRIEVPGVNCLCMAFSVSGDTIFSGWDDGTLRAFYPESGKLRFAVPNAAGNGLSAITGSNDNNRIVSGGGDGQVRVWSISCNQGGDTCTLEHTLKEHSSRVTSIMMTESDQECVSSSEDGTSIVWDLNSFTRSQIIFAQSSFRQVRYRPDEAQILTVGTDRKVAYWEVFDGSLIREVEVAAAGAVNTLSISADGENFVVGGEDKILKLFGYKEANRTHIGTGHSGKITRCQICPSQRFIVAGCSDGAVYRWAYPSA